MSDHLPAEIIARILFRVPVDALPRCRCVCKQWRSLIDSPSFTKLQIDHSSTTTRNASLLIVDEHSNLYVRNFIDGIRCETLIELGDPSAVVSDSTILFGSCNGLLCLGDETELTIGNPVTGKWHLMAPPSWKDFKSKKKEAYGSGYAFGYDSRSDDYKVVRIFHFLGPNLECHPSKLVHFGIRSNSRKIVSIPYMVSRRMGVFVGGAVHWVATRYNLNRPSPILIGFDLGLGECKEIPEPKYRKRGGLNLAVREMRKCLTVFDNCKGRFVDVWMMKEYGVAESWVKLFSVRYPRLSYDAEVRPLGFSMTGGELLLQLDCKKLVWYDMSKGSVEEMIVSGKQGEYMDAIVCFGSLVSPDGKCPPAEVKTDEQQKRDDFLATGFKLEL